jgi:[ribosomal protein S5]-alanine N-acetyltransferase
MIQKNFTPFPVLTTDRLTLRRLVMDDAEQILALRSDANVNQYLDRAPSQTIDDASRFIATIHENINKNEALYWAITLTGSPRLVGTICLFQFSDQNRQCDIGYELLPAFQGQGIMQEAAKKVIDHAFQSIGLHKIAAFTHRDNRSSVKLLEKFRFFKLGEDREDARYHIYELSR